jgi:PAS domain S-box-containing protein
MMPEGNPTSTPLDLFYDAFRASPIGIVLEDLEGQPQFVNPAFCRMLGFTEEELRHKHCVDFSPSEDAKKDWALFQQVRAGLIDHYQLDKRYFRKDGSVMWGRLSICLLKNRATPVVVAMVEDITEKQQAEQELKRSKAALQKLSGRLIAAQEDERARIARELHDDLAQRAAALAVDLHDVHNTLPPGTPAHDRIEQLCHLTTDLARDIQVVAQRLHSGTLEMLGLAAAATSLCRELSVRHHVTIDCRAEALPRHLSKEVALCLFRVLQEALSNALKHAGVSQVMVTLRGTRTEIQLDVIDQGVGFDPSTISLGLGLGFISMRERLNLVDGALSVESHPGIGTIVRVCVPFGVGEEERRPHSSDEHEGQASASSLTQSSPDPG